MFSSSREWEFTKFVNEEIATARSRHNSGRRRIPMPAIPRRRARCDRHEALAGIVSYGSAMEVWPLGENILLPVCTQRSIGLVAALASRLDPLALSGEKRSSSKTQFFDVRNGTSISDPEPVNFSCDPENWDLRGNRERSPLATASPLVLQLYRYSIGFPHVWCAIFAILRTPTRMVTTPHSLL